MNDYTLSIGVPMDVVVKSEGYVVVCHQIPMLLAGKSLDGMPDHVNRALDLVAGYLGAMGGDAASAYLKRRGVDHTFEQESPRYPDRPSSDRVFRYGGGRLVHANA